jgi:hypothetical protein
VVPSHGNRHATDASTQILTGRTRKFHTASAMCGMHHSYRPALLICAVALTLQSWAQQQTAQQRANAQLPKNPPTVTGAPVPEKLLAAKTVFLSVTTNKRDFHYKNAYEFLAKWDRWKIVDDQQQADLIIRITDGSDGTVGLASGSSTNVGSSSQGTAVMLGVPLHHYYLNVIDRESGESLWNTDTDERLAQSHDTKRMLKTLQQRIAEAEKAKFGARDVP